MKILQPFGPKIGEFQIDHEIIAKVNNFLDSSDNAKFMQSHANYLGGEIESERLIAYDKLNEHTNIVSVLGNCVAEYVNATLGKNISQLTFSAIWVNDMKSGEYNPIHWHDAHISGVFYTKSILDAEDKSIKKLNRDGAITFVHGSRQFLSESTLLKSPDVGRLFLFPSYLMHQVNPFRNEGIRRSIAFNCLIDKELVTKSW